MSPVDNRTSEQKIVDAFDSILKKLSTIKDCKKGQDCSEQVNQIVSLLQDKIVPTIKSATEFNFSYSQSINQYVSTNISALESRVEDLEAEDTQFTSEDAATVLVYVEFCQRILEALIDNAKDPESKKELSEYLEIGKSIVTLVEENTLDDDDEENEETEATE